MGNTKIEWATKTWNPVTGCTPISAGCAGCYAARMAIRIAGRCGYPAENPFAVTYHPERLDLPTKWKKPQRIFVNSMGDLFHRDVQFSWVLDVLEVISTTQRHVFMILTKRPENIIAYGWLDNLWIGVTVENAMSTWRIDTLRESLAPVRFISFEPLLEPVGKLDLSGIHWVIVGAETGPGARYMDPDWARDIRDQCKAAGVAFFFKKMSKKATIPDDLMIREFP